MMQKKHLVPFTSILKSIAMVATVAVFATALTACTKHSNQNDNIFKVAVKDDIKTLDPANAYDSVSLDILPSIEETLLQYKYLDDQMVLEPLLADGMPEYSKDGLTVTVKIKKGIHYSDDAAFKDNGGKGREIKASDFIYEFKRLAIPAIQSQGSWIFEDKVVGYKDFEKKLQTAKAEDFKKTFAEPIAGFTALDDYTLQFKMEQPYPLLNYILAMTFTTPIAPETADAYADKDGNLRDHPVGTGPFTLQSWDTGQRVTLVKNPNYKGTYPTEASDKLKALGFLADAGKPLPFLDGITFEIIKEEQPRLLKFEKGDIDNFELLKDSFRAAMTDATHLRDDLAQKGVQVGWEDSLIMYYVSFNMKDKILGSNKYLRQAIASTIDRDKWIDTFDKYKGTKQDQVGPPGLTDRVENAKTKYDFNIERGKALLAKAGYPEGKGLPTLNFDFRGADTKSRQMGEFFVQELGAIGIKINPILNTFPAYLEKAKQGNLQISYGGWTFDYPDVENGYQLLYGPNKSPGPNDANFENAQFDALYKKIAVLPAGAKGRKELVKQIDDLVQEESPWAYGYYMKTYRLNQARVKNYRVAEVIGNKYKYLRIDNTLNKK
jgi:oligopeptide transport system substrate-binding protein